MARLDAYATLGVARDAPDFVIQAAYRACLKRYHPDHYKGEDARRRTEDVLEAYRLVGDDAARDAYDRAHPAAGGRMTAGTASRGAPPSSPPPPTSPGARPSTQSRSPGSLDSVDRSAGAGRATTAIAIGACVVSVVALALAARPGTTVRGAAVAASRTEVSPSGPAFVAKVAPTPAPTVTATSTVTPSLDPVLALRDPARCDMAAGTERIFRGLVTLDRATWRGSRGPDVRLPGFERAVAPTFERRVQEGEGLNVRDDEATLPVDAIWHGLRVSRLRYRFMEESSFWEMQVRFMEAPATVRAALNRAGFALPSVGSWKEVSGRDEVTEGMGVEPIPGGAALTCGTSMYY